MIKSVSYTEFRGIQTGEMDGLSALNILVGPNGCGKSTALDGLLLACAADAQAAIGLVLSRHPALQIAPRWLLWRGQLTHKDLDQIRVEFGGATKIARIELSKVQGQLQIAGVKRRAEGDAELITDVTLVDPRVLSGATPLHELSSAAARRGKRQEVWEFVADLVPGGKGVEIFTDGGTPALHVTFDDGVVPAELLGDGLRSLLRIGFELAAHTGEMVLLEEPEAHQHPAAVRQSARAIWWAVQRGTQVLLTTHSLELIDHLLLAAPPGQLDLMRVIRMRLDRGQLHAVAVPGVDVKRLRTDIEEDLR